MCVCASKSGTCEDQTQAGASLNIEKNESMFAVRHEQNRTAKTGNTQQCGQ